MHETSERQRKLSLAKVGKEKYIWNMTPVVRNSVELASDETARPEVTNMFMEHLKLCPSKVNI